MAQMSPSSKNVALSCAFRLAWRQLWHEKIRFATAVLGVVFACILVFMQVGFKTALFESATLMQRTMKGDLYLQEVQSEALWRLVPFPRQLLYQALSVPGVEDVTVLYTALAPWKNPVTGINRTTLVLGIEPRMTGLFPLKGLAENRDNLQMRDVVLYDELSRVEFGPVKKLLAERGEFPVQIASQKLDVVGTFQMGISFSTDGNVIVSDRTFLKLFPAKVDQGVDLGIILLEKNANIDAVQAKLRTILPDNIQIMTRAQYIEDEKAYWNDLTPIGYIFNFGITMGLIVGLVIVYQVLFGDITNHMHEYATLKAMGYENSYFIKVVMSAASILLVCGFMIGWVLCLGIYQLVETAIFIPMTLTAGKSALTFLLIGGMCFLSAFLAIRKLKSASPVDVFQ